MSIFDSNGNIVARYNYDAWGNFKAKKIIAIVLLVNFLISLFAVESLAENEQSVFRVDSLNGTRRADYICVYQVSRHSAE